MAEVNAMLLFSSLLLFFNSHVDFSIKYAFVSFAGYQLLVNSLGITYIMDYVHEEYTLNDGLHVGDSNCPIV